MGAQVLLKMVASARTKPPSEPSKSKGMTICGSRDSSSIFQGQIAAKIVIARRMAVLSTVPWTVIARVSAREEAVLGSTPTKPPKDFEENAGFEVRKAVLMAMTASLALPLAATTREIFPDGRVKSPR